MGKIILASSSPRRADILKGLKLDFDIIPSSYVEPHNQTDFSYAYVENLAYNKALFTAKELQPKKHLVIGAEKNFVSDKKILGKPENFATAKKNVRRTFRQKTFCRNIY